MPRNNELKKILVIGSGPIVIGQAAEFDYAGTQACQALKEEGIEVVLINSNPATIMTDTNMADKVYIEPITLEFVTQIIRQERPDGLLPTLGGQTGLNMAVELARAGVLEHEGVKLLGTQLESIETGGRPRPVPRADARIGPAGSGERDRDERRGSDRIREAASAIRSSSGRPTRSAAPAAASRERGGAARDRRGGIRYSPIGQCLIEKSIAGMKEIEYEVMRDANDNCIVVCNMENVDPVGVHTGDSIVVAPSQTLSDREYQMLRSAALKIIRALEHRRRLQRAVRAGSVQLPILRHRSQPARQPLVGARVESDRLSDRQNGGEDRGRLHA